MVDKVSLDAVDLRILAVIQEDATLSAAAVAARVGLSHNACWRRVRRLEAAQVIRRRVALLDPGALGMNVTVFVGARMGDHSEGWFEAFEAAVTGMPEVLEFYRMSGAIDYLIKLRIESVAAYDRTYRRLLAAGALLDVSSTFVVEELKHTTALPFPEANRRQRRRPSA